MGCPVNRMMSMSLAIVAVAATGLLGCGGDDGGGGGGGGGELLVDGTTVPGAVEIEVEGFDFGYSPDPLVIPVDEPVNLTMRVTSGGHNLRIEGTGFQLPIIDEGVSVVGTLMVVEPGDYRMVCTVPGHEAAGMVATLRVG